MCNYMKYNTQQNHFCTLSLHFFYKFLPDSCEKYNRPFGKPRMRFTIVIAIRIITFTKQYFKELSRIFFRFYIKFGDVAIAAK